MKTYTITVLPLTMQRGTIKVADNVKIDEKYILKHWNKIKFDKPVIDYNDAAIEDIELQEEN